MAFAARFATLRGGIAVCGFANIDIHDNQELWAWILQ